MNSADRPLQTTTDPSTHHNAGHPRARIAETILLAAACLAALFLLAHLVAFEYGRDQGIYAVVGDAILRGDAPYKDAWDFKPPGIYFAYALGKGLFGSGMHAVRILEALGLLSMLGAFMILSRRHAGSARAGVIAWALAVFGYVHLDFWFTGQPENFAAVALAWALVCATYAPPDGKARRQRQWLAWIGAGALFAAAGILKPHMGGGILSSLAIVALARRRGVRMAAVAAFVLSGVLTVAAVVFYFMTKDALGDFYRTLFVFAPGYTAVDFDAAGLPGFVLQAVYEWLCVFTPFLVPGIALVLLLKPRHAREREGLLHIFGAIAFILVGIALQAKFFKYHYAAALALAALPAGWGIWKLWLRLRGHPIGWIGFAAAIVVLAAGWIPGLPSAGKFWTRCGLRHEALLDPEERTKINNSLYSLGDVNAGANRRAAAWIARNTAPEDTVFIWGFEPVIYEMARRRPASRYIYNVPLRADWTPAGARERLLEELDRSRPAAVVVVRGDILPRVTGNNLDSVAALNAFPELAAWIGERYENAVTFEDLMILRRKE